jgi:penicillin-binding protein 1C
VNRRALFRLLRRSAVAIGGILFAAALAAAVFVMLPLPADVSAPGPVPGLLIQDRHGRVIRTTRAPDGSRGGWIGLDSVDPRLLQAFLAAEDRRFFEHPGVDVRSMLRAARDNLRARSIVSGASTISMQTARLLRPAPRTWAGKLEQTLWALRMERHLTKQQILETYINRVPLGQGAIGVEAAARLYFGAPASRLGLGQTAMLAALARAPSRDNPLVDASRARERRNRLLDRMVALGFADRTDADRAASEPALSAQRSSPFLAPHFTTRTILWQDAAATGTWRTTLDLDLQTRLEAEVRHTVRTLGSKGARHAALVVLDNPSGDILAWVGSPDFFADTAGQVDMVVSPRQPGSALKPFLYALAFDHGFSPASVLPDVPRTYATSTGPYRPQNYDRRFRGPVRVREALASSYNVPAVELTEQLGATALLTILRDAGFHSLDRTAEYYGLGLSLGNGEVTLLELANGYRGLANGGIWTPWRWNLDAPPASSREGRRFTSAGAATLVLDILNDPIARLPGFGSESALDLPFPAAAKTGTSRHFTDNWAVAAAGRFTIAVWVGNFSGQPMQAVSGISGAGPLLHRAALVVAQQYSPGALPSPERAGAMAMPVCVLSGLRATPDCPALLEWFLPGTEPMRPDDWQTGGRTMLPPEYAEWLAMEAPRGFALAADRGFASAGSAEERQDAADLTNGAPRIISPLDGDEYEAPPDTDTRYATLPLLATPDADGRTARWYVDGKPHDASRWRIAPGTHVIRAVWSGGRSDSVRVTVR